jgi:hypothetical protein
MRKNDLKWGSRVLRHVTGFPFQVLALDQVYTAPVRRGPGREGGPKVSNAVSAGLASGLLGVDLHSRGRMTEKIDSILFTCGE